MKFVEHHVFAAQTLDTDRYAMSEPDRKQVARNRARFDAGLESLSPGRTRGVAAGLAGNRIVGRGGDHHLSASRGRATDHREREQQQASSQLESTKATDRHGR
ncbi:MAG: hypothetical protein ABGY29_17735, partial [bacterium]